MSDRRRPSREARPPPSGRTAWIAFIAAAVGGRLLMLSGADLWGGEVAWLSASSGDLTRSPAYCALLDLWSGISREGWWLRSLSWLLALGAALQMRALARRAFGSAGLHETSILIAFSPLLASAAWEVHPLSLELFVAAFWLDAFLRFLESPGRRETLLCAGGAAAAVAAGPHLPVLAAAQAVVVVLFRWRGPGAAWRWFSTLLPAAALAAAIGLVGSGEAPAERPEGPQETTLQRTGLLFTDMALGRLHAWRPLTPAMTFGPPDQGGAGEAHSIGSPESDGEFWFLQGMQLLFLGCFGGMVLLAPFAVWRLRVRPLPEHLRRRASAAAHHDPARPASVALLLALVLPVIWPLVGGGADGEGIFPERRLLFAAAPFLILAGRGFACMQWALGRYVLLAAAAGIAVYYSVASSGLAEGADGSAAAGAYVGDAWRPGDALVAEGGFEGPVRWYAGLGAARAGAPGASGPSRLWAVRFEAPPGSPAEGIDVYLRAIFGRTAVGRVEEAFIEAHPGGEVEERRRGSYLVSLWTAEGSPR